ncbi:MAG: methyltransferase [Pseudomonadota bacterium]
MPERQAPAFADREDAAVIAGSLRDAGYTQDAVAGLLDFSGLAAPPEQLDALRARAAENTALALHARLWFLGDTVPVADARAHLTDLERWASAGLLRVQGEDVVPEVAITARHDLFIVADTPAEVRTGAPVDHVMGPAQSTVLVERAMVEAPMASCLDLGTGSGYLALRAAAHTEAVTATDVNERAVAMTCFNAQLNGVENINVLNGSLYEPVADRQFDLIVCSPPYVISPGDGLMFCESGWRGDLFCRQLLRQAAGHLADGGLCQAVCNWGHGADQSWQDTIAEWFNDLGCDAMVLGGDWQDAADYATNWIRDTRARGADTFEREHPRWMAYFESEGIEKVSYGVVTLRRRTGDNWVQCEPAPAQFGEGSGNDIVRRMNLRDYLERTPDGALLDDVVVVAPGLQMAVPEESDANRILRQRRGLIQDIAVDPNIAGLIERCTGNSPLRDTLQAIAKELGVPFDQFAPMALATVRGLVGQGILQPATM